MPIGSPFHARTSEWCESLSYREWAGYYAVSAYETHHEHEYNAIRQGAGIIDVSPLFKYIVSGPDATMLVDRVITRDATRLTPGQVIYTTWCDHHGKVVDDGTVTRLGEQRYRWTAADSSLRWFQEQSRGLQVSIEDVTDQIAALAIQGPRAAALLGDVADAPLNALKYFRATTGAIAGVPVDISRTGYTGDLGYEIWIPADRAVAVLDAILDIAPRHGGRLAGLLALDVARIEAGLLLGDVDFTSSRKALVESHKYSPFEMGLGRLVHLGKAPFLGHEALEREAREGAPRQVVGLEVDWQAFESAHERAGLPPQVPMTASRTPVPIYRSDAQVGKATSTTWSPTLKKLIALATVRIDDAEPGSIVDMEITVDAVRLRAPALVVRTPFFNPARKTAAVTSD
jgi:aminomethyltransferase